MEEKEGIESRLEGSYLSNPKEFFYGILRSSPFLTEAYVRLTEFTQRDLPRF